MATLARDKGPFAKYAKEVCAALALSISRVFETYFRHVKRFKVLDSYHSEDVLGYIADIGFNLIIGGLDNLLSRILGYSDLVNSCKINLSI